MPGAGKTRLVAALAQFLGEKINLVLFFTPSCQVVEGIRTTFIEALGRRFDCLEGAIGDVFTISGYRAPR